MLFTIPADLESPPPHPRTGRDGEKEQVAHFLETFSSSHPLECFNPLQFQILPVEGTRPFPQPTVPIPSGDVISKPMRAHFTRDLGLLALVLEQPSPDAAPASAGLVQEG